MDRGNQLDLSSEYPRPAGGKAGEERKFLGVTFACCDVYARVYINHEKTAYQGRCPRCGRPIEFQIGEGGTDARFFRAE